MAMSQYDQINLDSKQQANIQALKDQYKYIQDTAMQGGGVDSDTQAKLDRLHSAAEQIRAEGGYYSGGSDGSEYIPLQKPKGDDAPTAPILRGPSSQESYVNDLYDAQKRAAVASLKSAYENNRVTLDAQAEKIPAIYQQARNNTAATAEQNRAAFNEYAAASGLNSGAGGQAQLAMRNQMLGNMSSINSQEAQAKNDLETERTRLAVNYENAIAQAVAEGDLQKAQALYQEAVRVDEGLVDTSLSQANLDLNYWSAGNQVSQQQLAQKQTNAQTLAAYGDFSGFLELGYTQNQIDQMYKIWAAQNPLLAAALGKGSFNYGSGGGRYKAGNTKTETDVPKQTGGTGLGEAARTDGAGNITHVTVRKGTGNVLMPVEQAQRLVKQGVIKEQRTGNGKIIYIYN